MTKHFGLTEKQEAVQYLAHPVLGKRLMECVQLLPDQPKQDVHDIFGSFGCLKLRSCLTLVSVVSKEACFEQAPERFYAGKQDQATLQLMSYA